MAEYVVDLTGADVKTAKELSSSESIEMMQGLRALQRARMDYRHRCVRRVPLLAWQADEGRD